MRHWGALGTGLLAVLLGGCVSGQPLHSASLMERFWALHNAARADGVQMYVALIERPVGDRYINQDLWGLADELVVDPSRMESLEDNGFRVAQVGSNPPAELQQLILSERSCANPRKRVLPAGESATLQLGPAVAHGAFQVRQDGPPVSVHLDQAQFGLVVTPTVTADGRTRLQFTPQVQHGEVIPQPCVAPDLSGFVLERQRPTETYPALGWDVTVGPNEYVVVGARFEKPDSLGYQAFVRADDQNPVQRLLVIRAFRSNPGAAADAEPSAPDAGVADGPPPLALQATWTAARGKGP
jgi:hypothetical protein